MIYEPIMPKYIKEEVKEQLIQQYEKINEDSVFPSLIEQYAEMIGCDDIVKQHYGLVAIRKLMSTNQNPADISQSIIKCNLVPILIQILEYSSNQLFIFESIWILTNVASGTNQQTQVVVKNGGIPNLLKHLNSKHILIVEQVCWAIGNIAADDGEYRFSIIQQGGLQQFIEISEELKQKNNKLLIKLCSWTISNLCRGNPKPPIEKLKRVLIQYFSYIIQQFDENETLIDACWALSYISNSNQGLDPQQEIIDTGIVPKLIELLRNNQNNSVIYPCVRIIGNILSGTDIQKDYVLNLDILDAFAHHLQNTSLKSLIREICWCISNITAGSSNQINRVIKNENIMIQLYTLFRTFPAEIQTEIALIYSNAMKEIKTQDTIKLVEMGSLEIFARTLKLQRISSNQREDIIKSLDNIFNNMSQICGSNQEYILEFFNKFNENQMYQLENENLDWYNCYEKDYFLRWKNSIKK